MTSLKKFIFFLLLISSIPSWATTSHYTLAYRDDPATTITIGWSGDDGTVYYGTQDFGINYSSYPQNHATDRMATHKGQNRKFARLTGLSPNTVYYFVIHDSNNNTSQRFKFQTLSDDPNNPVCFVSGGDTRDGFSLLGIYIEDCPSGDCRQRRKDGNQIVSKIRPDFVAFNGDFIQNQITSDVTQEWNNWLDDWQLSISADGKIYPIVLTQGNHEDNSDMYNIFDIPQDEYYALDIHSGLFRFYSLNSEIGACDATQLAWFTNDLQNHTGSASAPAWKIVQHHHPTYAMALYGLNQDQMDSWVGEFESYGVDLVMESHSHTTKWSWPCVKNSTNDGYDVDTLDGIVYIGEGQWGAPHRDLDYTGSSQKTWIRDQDVFDNFFFIRVSQDTIQIENVSFENISSIANIYDDQLGSFLPNGTTTWNPSNGNVIYITKTNSNVTEQQFNVTDIFPNPSKSIVYINFNKILNNNTIEVYNSLGKLCIKEELDQQNSYELNMEKLCSGVNYIIIKNDKGHVESHKVIKIDP